MSSYWLTSELILTDENQMVFGIGDRAGRTFWGCVLAGLGVIAIVVPLVIGPENMGMDPPAHVAQLLAAVMGLVFMLVGWAVASSFEELRLDLNARTYLRRKGTWPWVRRREGNFDAFSHVSLEPEKRECQNSDVVVWMAVLVWKSRAEERMTLFEKVDHLVDDSLGPLDQMRTQLKHIAVQLGLEIQELAIPAVQAVPLHVVERIRWKLYGGVEERCRGRQKAAAMLGLMTFGSLFVRMYGEWRIAEVILVSGYLLWVLLVLYVCGGLLWEVVDPSGAKVKRTPLRILLFAGLTLTAAAICVIAPILW